MSWISDNTLKTLEASLDLRQVRQNLLTANIANASTPHYDPVDLKFRGALAAADAQLDTPPAALERTDPGHMSASMTDPDRSGVEATSGPASEVVTRPDVTNSLDGNGVNLDTELARLTDNAVRYDTGVEATRRRFAITNYVITQMTTA